MGAGHSTHGGGSSGSTTTAGAVLVSPRHRRQSRTPSRHAQTPPLAGGTALDAQLQSPQQQCHHHRHLHLPHIQGSRRASCVPLTPSSHATTLFFSAPQPPPSLTPLPLSQQQQQQQQQQQSSSSSSRRCSARKKCSVTSSSERMLLHGDNGAEHRSSVCVRRLGNVSAYTSPQATPRTLLSLGKSAALHTCMHTPHLHTLVDKLTTASSTTTATATATNTTTTTPATEALRVVTTRNDDQQQQQQQQKQHSKCDKVRCARDAVLVRQCVAQAKQHERGEQKQQQQHQQQSQQKASAVLSIATAHLWRMAVQWVAVTEVVLVTDWCARRARSAHGPHAAGAVSSSSPAANATAAAVEVPLSCDAVPFPYNRTTCIVYTPSCDVAHNNNSCSSSSGGRGNVAAAAAACASGLPAELPVGEAYYNALCAAWRQPAAESVVRNNNSNDVPLALPPVADEDDLDDSLILESIEEAVSCEFSPAIPLQHMIALLVPEWEEEGLYDDPL